MKRHHLSGQFQVPQDDAQTSSCPRHWLCTLLSTTWLSSLTVLLQDAVCCPNKPGLAEPWWLRSPRSCARRCSVLCVTSSGSQSRHLHIAGTVSSLLPFLTSVTVMCPGHESPVTRLPWSSTETGKHTAVASLLGRGAPGGSKWSPWGCPGGRSLPVCSVSRAGRTEHCPLVTQSH